MTETARQILRDKFRSAGLGISGVNSADAEKGPLCLVENEGNGRFCTTLPSVHIALMGIEKVVGSLQDLPPLLTMLTRSATGHERDPLFVPRFCFSHVSSAGGPSVAAGPGRRRPGNPRAVPLTCGCRGPE